MNRIDKHHTPLTWLVAFLMAALVAGCGGGGGQDPILGTGANAGLAPTVTAVFPTPNATGVPINTKIITAAFTKPMDPATLNTASFTLTCPAGTPQAGTVGYVTTGDVATLTLAVANSLPANSLCTATITTGAKDTTGIPLDSNFVWKFTTGLVPDTTAPTVTGTINAAGATGVAINTKVGATFSEAMDPLTINATTFTLKQGTNTVAGTVTYAGVNAVFTPASNLAPNTPYTVTVTTGAKDVRGNPLASNFVISWTTGAAPDTTAPTVTNTINANGATGVAINTNAGATFSEGMDPLTMTNVNFTLKEAVSGNAVVGVVSYSGVSAVFNPVNSLASSMRYTTTMKGGLTGVKDLAGNPLASDFVWSWTTGAAPDTTAPTVTGTINANGATGVAINSAVGATFSEGMNPLTVTNVNFTLTTDAGVAVPGVVSYSGVNAVFRPLTNLASSTHYNVTVKSGLTGVKDLAGNPLAADFKIGWTTAAAPDTTAPTVTNTINANGATDVAINTAVGATFSEGMDPLTVTNLNFTLTTDAGAVVPATVTYSGVSAVFRPLTNLASNTHYNVTVKSGATGVKDLAGNPMAADFKIGWTTAAAPDTTAPTVTRTIHTNGQTNVAVNTTVGATFSEGMDPLTITNLSFFLKETATGTLVPATLSYSGVTATIIPLNSLAASTNYTVTVKGGVGGVEDLAGNQMASDFSINWTTGVIPDATAPTVTAVSPLDKSFGVGIGTAVNAAFSEDMDPLTVTTSTFTLQLQNGPFVPGTVYYSAKSAAFTPLSPLAEVSRYLAKITTAAKDIVGNAMTSDFVWDFVTTAIIVPGPGATTTTTAAPTTTTTAAPTTTTTAGATTTTTAGATTTTAPGATTTTAPGATTTTTVATTTTTTVVSSHANPAAVNLLSTTGFAILAKTTITNASHLTRITGNIGVSPAAGSFMSNVFCTDITGTIYGVDATYVGSGDTACYLGGGANKTLVDNAILDMGTAYGDAVGRTGPDGTELYAGAIGGKTFERGLYKWSSDVSIASDVTLTGSATDVWIFQIAGNLSIAAAGDVTSGIKVKLSGGAQASNVFWQVGGGTGATLDTYSTFNGTILSAKQVILRTGAVLNGRAFADSQVVLDANPVTKP